MENWNQINDAIARQMLKELYENLHDDDLIERYSIALEKKYRKSEGTISDFVFFNDYSVDEIMEKLKIDDVTYL